MFVFDSSDEKIHRSRMENFSRTLNVVFAQEKRNILQRNLGFHLVSRSGWNFQGVGLVS